MHSRPLRALIGGLGLLLAAVAPSVLAVPSGLDVSVPSALLRPGDRFEALLSLPLEGLTSVDLSFDFDPTRLSLVSSGVAADAPAPFMETPGEIDGKPTLLFLYFDPLEGPDPAPLVSAIFEIAGGARGGPAVIGFKMLVNGGVTDGGSDLLGAAAITVVPEPSSIALMLGGLGVGALVLRRRTPAR